jgi:hypothetical protein
MKDMLKPRAILSAGIGEHSEETITLHGRYEATYFNPDGSFGWKETIENLVVTVGKNDLLDKYLAGSSYTAAFYMGLTNSSPTPAAGDTMASHGGWTEFTGYSNSNRISCAWNSASAGSKALSAALVFNINTNSTVGGAFITTNNTISGTTGTLFSCGAFSGGNQAVTNGGTLSVSYSLGV